MAKSGKKRTGWVAEELYFWHHTQNWAGLFEPGLSVQPGEHFENAETKRRFRNLVEASGFGRHLVPVRAAPAETTEPPDATGRGAGGFGSTGTH